MAYEKLTLSAFKKKLDEGHYNSPGGARKAISRGKDWSKEEQDKAHSLTNKHFGEAAPKASRPRKAAQKDPVQQVLAAVTPRSYLVDANQTVGTIGNILASLKMAKDLGANDSDVAKVAKASQRALLQVVEQVICLTDASSAEETSEDLEQQRKTEIFQQSAPGSVHSVLPASQS